LTPNNLLITPFLAAQHFHLLATPLEILSQVPHLHELRRQHGFRPDALITWEPFPGSCTPEHLAATTQACKLTTVFSPNHIELCALFSSPPPHAASLDKTSIETHAKSILKRTVERGNASIVVVVRCGEHGSLTLDLQLPSEGLWLPAFHAAGSEKVVDATGAGNAFVGAFVVALAETESGREASAWGNVVASLVVEQIWMPEVEKWNGVVVRDRFEEYEARLAQEKVFGHAG
jgi:sugar/nucleoside kinase (ribokinase family)